MLLWPSLDHTSGFHWHQNGRDEEWGVECECLFPISAFAGCILWVSSTRVGKLLSLRLPARSDACCWEWWYSDGSTDRVGNAASAKIWYSSAVLSCSLIMECVEMFSWDERTKKLFLHARMGSVYCSWRGKLKTRILTSAAAMRLKARAIYHKSWQRGGGEEIAQELFW